MKLWDAATGECLRSFEGQGGKLTAVGFSGDGRFAIAGGEDGALRLWFLDWELGSLPAGEWDEAARPWLRAFIARHTPYAVPLPRLLLTGAALARSLAREGSPQWSDDDFCRLLADLRRAGFLNLRPERVQHELAETTAADD